MGRRRVRVHGCRVAHVAYGTLPGSDWRSPPASAATAWSRRRRRFPHSKGSQLETAVLVVPAALYLLALNGNGSGAFLNAGATTDLLLVAGGVVTVVPLLLFATAVRRVPLSVVGILQYIAPTIQFLLGVFAFREPFTRTQLSGFGFVWLGLVVFTLDSMRPRQSPSFAVVDEGAR